MDHRSARDLDTGADRIVNQLTYRYEGLFDRDRIDTLFHDSYDRLAETARVTIFLPALAEILTIQRLDALAQAEGKVAKRVPEVLFVCVGNAGRSQMAAALTRHHADTRLHIRTGGSNPHEAIYPEVVQVMAEAGLSLGGGVPQAAHQRSPGRRRCRGHDGLWRVLPDPAGTSLRGPGHRRPRGPASGAGRRHGG